MSYALQILWYDRQRYVPAVLAVAFSCLLIALQCGLLMGLFSATSIPIDESGADIWVGHPEVSSVDLGRSIPEAWQSYLALPEIERVEPFNEGFGYWDKPSGGMELVLVVGSRLGPDSLGAVKELTAEHRQQLSEPNAVVIDEGEFDRLGVTKVGDTAEIFGKRVRVVGTVTGLRSLAGPYVFCSLDTARGLLRWPPDQCTFFLAKCTNKKDAAKVVAKLRAYPERFAAFTAEEFSWNSRVFWLTKTKAGIAFGLAAVLGLLVGAVVTSQTLFGATMASIKEYAVLRGVGIPRWRLETLVLAQSFWVGIGGIATAFPAVFALAFLAGTVGAKVLLPIWLLAIAAVITMTMAMSAGLLALRSLRIVEPVTLLR